MRNTIKGFILLIFGCLCGCDSTVIVEESLEANIYPLKVGNSWRYLFTAHENETLDIADTILVEIIGTEVVEYDGRSLEVFQERTTWTGIGSEPLVILLRHEEDGLYRYFKDNHKYPPGKQHYIKYPAVIGDSWRIDHGDYAYEPTFESVDAEFVTPAGTFNSYQASMGVEGGWWSRSYYSPGVGLVASEGEALIDSGTYRSRQVLLQYAVN